MDITILKSKKAFYKVDATIAALFIEAGLAERKNPEPLTEVQESQRQMAAGNTTVPFYETPKWVIATSNAVKGRPIIRRFIGSEVTTFAHEHLQAVYDTAEHNGCPKEVLKEFKALAEQYTKREQANFAQLGR